MVQLTVTAKGQVTLRRELLDHLGVRPGDRIDVEKLPDGRITARAVPQKGRLADLAGALRRDDQPSLTLAEIDAAIAAAGRSLGGSVFLSFDRRAVTVQQRSGYPAQLLSGVT